MKAKPVKKSPTLEQVGKAAPHLFFVKHGGKQVKNPHFMFDSDPYGAGPGGTDSPDPRFPTGYFYNGKWHKVPPS